MANAIIDYETWAISIFELNATLVYEAKRFGNPVPPPWTKEYRIRLCELVLANSVPLERLEARLRG